MQIVVEIGFAYDSKASKLARPQGCTVSPWTKFVSLHVEFAVNAECDQLKMRLPFYSSSRLNLRRNLGAKEATWC